MRHAPFWLAALAAIAGPLPAAAQLEGPASRPRLFAPAPPAAEAPDAAIRPLALAGDRLVLRGEYDTDERPVFLAPAEALRATAFRLVFGNAVSNLPEGSRLAVLVNDQYLGEARLDAAGRPGRALFAIPPGLLSGGFNAVKLVASQRHRVDCSVAATYELWSEVDLAASGFVGLPARPAVRRLADLPALAASGAAQTPIRLRLPADADAARIDQAMRAANAVILAALIQRPLIEVAPGAGTGPGLDLVLGGEPPAGAAQLDPELGLFLSADREDGRDTLTVTATDAADLEGTLRRLEEQARTASHAGTAQGRRALANGIGRRIAGGASLSLAELGLGSRSFDGHFMRASFGFAMPGSFFSAPYGSAQLTLDSAFTGEAGERRSISVRVNDQIAAVLPIRQRGPGEREQRRIDLPMQMFKPGLNTVSLEADLVGDSACETDPASARRRLSIDGASRLSFGRIADMAVFPALSATVSHGHPHAGSREPLTVAVSPSDPRYLDAALTFVGRMTASGGSAVPIALRFGPLDGPDLDGLFVGPPSEATQTLARLAGLPDGAFPAQPAAASLYAADGTVRSDAGLQPPAPALPANPYEVIEPVKRTLGASLAALGQSEFVQRLRRGDLGGIVGWLQDFGLVAQSARAASGVPVAREPDAVTILQEIGRLPREPVWKRLFAPSELPSVKTMVLAAEPALLPELIERVTSPHVWSRLAGESAIVRLEGWGPENSFPAAPVYQPGGDRSPGNLRLVVAGWLSLNPWAYLAVLGALALLLALTTTAVLRTRRR